VLPHQEKDVSKLAAQAGVQAERSRVRPGDADLARVTGARQPTGVALAERPAETRPQSSRPARSARSGQPNRFERSARRGQRRSTATR
jgi:hypothetical protein